MNRAEYLLTCLAEECVEVAQRAMKALRFGLSEVQTGQDKTNIERIEEEFIDLLTVMAVFQKENSVPQNLAFGFNKKLEKLQKYMEYAKSVGTVDKDSDTNFSQYKIKPWDS